MTALAFSTVTLEYNIKVDIRKHRFYLSKYVYFYVCTIRQMTCM